MGRPDMLPPPPQGSPTELLPPTIGNPEAWACVIAWDAWKTFAGQGITECLNELQTLQGGILA